MNSQGPKLKNYKKIFTYFFGPLISLPIMNTKKISVLAVSILLAASSAFAWSKKSENTGNLGRMYLSIGGGVNVTKAKIKGTNETSSPTGGVGMFELNAPVFKPGINAFKDIKWAGLDAQAFFNYDYTGKFSGKYNGVDGSITNDSYGVGVALVPYLNFETGLSFFKAIKPYAKGFCGYMWNNTDTDGSASALDVIDGNYFFYGVGAGVEFVLLDEVSVTPWWQWNGNAQSGMPTYQTAGVEASYWVNDMFCVSAFWSHSFGMKDYLGAADLEQKHGDVIGLKFKLGFSR